VQATFPSLTSGMSPAFRKCSKDASKRCIRMFTRPYWRGRRSIT
jgi:hypothetical protein